MQSTEADPLQKYARPLAKHLNITRVNCARGADEVHLSFQTLHPTLTHCIKNGRVRPSASIERRDVPHIQLATIKNPEIVHKRTHVFPTAVTHITSHEFGTHSLNIA